jgi:hypothetical protein
MRRSADDWMNVTRNLAHGRNIYCPIEKQRTRADKQRLGGDPEALRQSLPMGRMDAGTPM